MSQSTLPVVQSDSRLKISFTLSLADGTLVESTSADEPFEFQIGDGNFLPNLEELLIGLEQETKAKFTLPPESAFGFSDPANVQSMARDAFPEDMVLELNQVIGFNTPTGNEVPGRLVAVDEKRVQIDFNHPLANQTLIFDVQILEVLS